MRVDPCPMPIDGDATCGGQGGGKRKLVTQEDAEQEQEPAGQQQMVEEGLQVDEGRQVAQKVVSLGGRRLVSEVDGLKLHLSKQSSTGYKGVVQLKSGGRGAFKVGSQTNPAPTHTPNPNT